MKEDVGSKMDVKSMREDYWDYLGEGKKDENSSETIIERATRWVFYS